VRFKTRSVLLDECLGSGFSIVGYDCEPRQYLEEQTITAWQGIGASVVRIASAQTEPDGPCITDPDNTIGDWTGKHAPMILLIRPDRFCMAAAGPREAQARLGNALELIAGKSPVGWRSIMNASS
jgi:3-(3-hydroxy-phenyl)propionate hydroxylase